MGKKKNWETLKQRACGRYMHACDCVLVKVCVWVSLRGVRARLKVKVQVRLDTAGCMEKIIAGEVREQNRRKGSDRLFLSYHIFLKVQMI